MQVSDSAATLGLSTTSGTASFNTGQWYRIEMALDLTAAGVVKVWVDGALDINVTHSNDVSATTTGSFRLFGVVAPNELFFDDIRIDTGGVAAIGAGQIIARQGKTGTPTYDTWTKTGLATAALCWSETPFSATNNCNSAVSAAKQTMLVEKFSITQSGHGTQVVGASDTVNACKVALIAKTVSGDATGQILRRINGTDTGTVFTDTASDVYYDDGFWTTTVANLDLLEAGLIHGNNTRVTQVEDVWVIVDYTPGVATLPAGTVYDLSTSRLAVRRAATLMEPQAQYARVVGQETLPLFVADLRTPAPRVYPLENRGFIHDTDVHLIAKDTLPNFSAEWKIPAAIPRGVTLRDPISQYNRVVGQETLPQFNAEWKAPAPRNYPVENRGFVHDTDVQLIGQDKTPNFVADLRMPPPPLRRLAMDGLGFIHDLDAQLLGQDQVPVFSAEWRVPAERPRLRDLVAIDWQTYQSELLIGQETLPVFVYDLRTPQGRAGARDALTIAGQPDWLLLWGTPIVVQSPFTQFDFRIPGSNYSAQLRVALLTTTGLGGLTPIPPIPGISHYGVTAGPEISVHSGLTLLNAHGVGGNQAGLSGAEGIPYDAPQ